MNMAPSEVLERALPLVVPTQPGDSAPRGHQLYVISIVMVVISGVFVIARIGARMSSSTTGGLGVDDLYVMLSLISSVVLSVTEIQATIEGYGNHMKDLTKAQILASLKWFYLAQIFYKVVITFNKMALLAFYLRIFPNRKFRILCYAGLIFIVSSGLAYILATIWQCTPIAFYWNRRLPDGHCIESAPFWISYATINIITDFYILILPMPLINKLSLSRRNKYALMAVFAMGGFVCFTTIIRMTTLASSAKGTDFTYGPVPATNWSVIEANTGLICACLPMLKQYLGVIMQMFTRSGHNLESSSTYTGKIPRSQGFDSGNYKLSARSRKDDKSEIFGTGNQWGAVDSNITSNGRKGFPDDNESQEHIIPDSKGIQMTTDVHWHGEAKSHERQ